MLHFDIWIAKKIILNISVLVNVRFGFHSCLSTTFQYVRIQVVVLPRDMMNQIFSISIN